MRLSGLKRVGLTLLLLNELRGVVTVALILWSWRQGL